MIYCIFHILNETSLIQIVMPSNNQIKIVGRYYYFTIFCCMLLARLSLYKYFYKFNFQTVKNLVSTGEKSLLVGIRYVKICCRTKWISFLIIVLPVYLFLYTYIRFFANQSGISRREIFCGRCHPASEIRLDIPGNTANADGIRPGHSW